MPSVIVIGAGVVGASIAWELSGAGCRVQLLDARTPGDGATRASAGVLAPYIEGHPDSPLRNLGRQSLDLYDDFVARLRGESHREVAYDRSGTLEVALSDAHAERLAAASAALWHDGVEARWVPPVAVPDVEPGVTSSAAGGLLIPVHGAVGVASLTAAAVAAAIARGVEVVQECGALDIEQTAGGGVTVRHGAGVFEADHVVLAAGSWSSQVRVSGADPVPVKPVRGQLLQLGGRRGVIGRVIWGEHGYLVPWADGSVLVGATVEDVGFDESTTPDARRQLMEMATSLVPELANAGIADMRAGLRPRGPDDLPLIGRSRVVPGLVYATAHFRNGVLLAPLTAQLVRRLVVDPAASTLPALDPGRCGHL